MRADRRAILAWRARAQHLDTRLPPDGVAAAAWGGLQDSSPRSGLLSLHARLVGTAPGSWEDPALAQVWGPRLAAYLVPEADVAPFTLGRLPRDPAACRGLETRAAAIVAALGGEARRARAVAEALGGRSPADVRAPAATGRYRIRWDARLTWLVPARRPAAGEAAREAARQELARRYLGWLGPGTTDGFARWAGIEPADARRTWAAIEDELVAVAGPGGPGWLQARHADALVGAEPVAGVRLLPDGDPYLAADRALLVADRCRRDVLWSAPDRRPALADGTRFTPGAVLADGEVVGIWGRRQRTLTLMPWERWSARRRDAVTTEAEACAAPLGGPVRVDVLAGW